MVGFVFHSPLFFLFFAVGRIVVVVVTVSLFYFTIRTSQAQISAGREFHVVLPTKAIELRPEGIATVARLTVGRSNDMLFIKTGQVNN